MGKLSRFIYIYKQRLRINLEGIVCSVQWVGERGGESSSQILAQPCTHNCTNYSFQQCNYLQSCEVRPASPNTQNPFLLSVQTSRTAAARSRRRVGETPPGLPVLQGSQLPNRRAAGLQHCKVRMTGQLPRPPCPSSAEATGSRDWITKITRRRDRFSSNRSDYAPKNDRTGRAVTIRQIYNRQISQDMKIAGSTV